jgi:DNA-directed RNA polymerase sigma subunit (sigma70/sigma32)
MSLEPAPFCGDFETRLLHEKAAAGYRLTYCEVGFLLGISAARVQQIERKALAKLRRALERAGCSADDLPQD